MSLDQPVAGAAPVSPNVVGGKLEWVIKTIAVLMSLYQMAIAWFGVPIGLVHRPLHVMFALALLFLSDVYRGGKDRGLRVSDAVLVLLSVASTGFLIINAVPLSERIPYVYGLTTAEFVWGTVFLIVILEAARRTVGMVLVWVTGIFLLYGYAGRWLPYPFWHRGFTLEEMVEQVYLTLDSVWGAPVYVTSTYVFVFILFGCFLVSSGAGDFFTDLSRALMGRTVGGGAKTAVFSSALMGTLSGSSVANVVTTGSFTIPTMKKQGYEPPFAAAVEAVASSGGQLMPPVMGAAAFIMAEVTGIPYIEIMKHAVVPAFLYFFSVFMMVHLEARRLGLRPDLTESLPRLGHVLKQRGYLIIPLMAIVWLLVQGYTPLRAAFWAVISLVALVFIFDPENRKRIGAVILESLLEAPKLVIPVTVACAASGIIVGITWLTGLDQRIASVVLTISGGNLPLTLILTMVVAIILGMGMPTSSAYIVMAALLAPGIVELGVPLVAAHMFVFFFACISAITPPVAIASYAAAGIAETDPTRTGFEGLRLGSAAFLIPFMFVYGPALLLIGSPQSVILAVVTATIGVIALAGAAVGWIRGKASPLERVALAAAAITLIDPSVVTDVAGLALLVAAYGMHSVRLRRQETIAI